MSKEENKEDMEALKKELDEVKKHLATVIAKEKSAMEPKVVFTPRERKLTKFSGQKDCEQTVEEFIDEVELLLRTRPTSSEEKVDFILSHLEGPAREELRYRSASEKKTPATVLGILREVFGEKSTISELLSDFYQCRQKEGQSLQEYSHDLMNKLSKVCKRDPKAVQDRDKAIRSQFAENVREPWLKRDLKKRLRDHPDLAFNDIREEVGRNKIQDAWDASKYIIIKRIDPNKHVHLVEPSEGGERRIENRMNIKPCVLVNNDFENERRESKGQRLRNSIQCPSNEESDNESDEDDPIAIGYEGSQPLDSARSNAGTHSNLHHLPR
ncbi:unnamed protein product [Mytilus coruscus]|uniref:Paraneoplastic antigen Ma-like C-terminal domain-containing protein n=1 Tax=Mytilus coruscus TaxID=42192 RepID=A0A6J8F581_MYTCO|nr:unnamed protein product [Mytilus coruscus]